MKLKKLLEYDYIKDWKNVSLVYLLLSILLAFSFRGFVIDYISINNIGSLIALFILLIAVFPTLNKILPPEAKPLPQVWLTSFKREFIVVKFFEILFQQLFVAISFNIATGYFTKPQLVFLIFFVSMHLLLFFNREPKIAFIFIFLSFLGSYIFYNIYSNYSTIAFIIAFSIHILFYLTMGIMIRNIMHSEMWDKYYSLIKRGS